MEEQEKAYGEDIVLLEKDDDLSSNTHWQPQGYCVASFLPEIYHHQFIRGTYHLFKEFLDNADIVVPDITNG